MTYESIRLAAFDANIRIVEAGLVLLTWGNASACDRDAGVFAIKPSGVDYDDLSAEQMVVVSIETGEPVDGELRPSSDTATHAELYRSFPTIGGVVHTHSHYAVCFAQAHRPIPCLGTTHADHFRTAIPVTRPMTEAEVSGSYELSTGTVIAETFRGRSADPRRAASSASNGESAHRQSGAAGFWHIHPDEVPSVLVANHGPFSWGPSAAKAVENAVVLEEVARMALHTELISKIVEEAPRYLSDKHFLRKHGANAYYGQGLT